MQREWICCVLCLLVVSLLTCLEENEEVMAVAKKLEEKDWWFSTRRWLSEASKWESEIKRIDIAIAAKRASVSSLLSENIELRARQEILRPRRRFVRFYNEAADCELSVGIEADDDWMRCEQGAGLGAIFELRAVGGAVSLKSAATGRWIEMVPPGEESGWVLRTTPLEDRRSSFRLVDGSYVQNVASGGCVTVMRGGKSSSMRAVRGHGNKPHNKEPGSAEDKFAAFKWRRIQPEEVVKLKEKSQEKPRIASFSNSTTEKRVVSYGLYGANPKYTTGAVRNSELVHTIFPGWVTRFYVRDDVPKNVLDTLRANGAEIVTMGKNAASGNVAGMFWRFLVADDPEVDRFIVRDSDSRLNMRDAAAVEEWINSGLAVHTIRDHPNHDRPLNGGLWGGTKNCVPGIGKKIRDFGNRGSYGGDLQFLNTVVWPIVKDNQLGHDAYTCTKYPNSRPFPTKRPGNYQHVGQVFNAKDLPRMADINGFLRNRPIPNKCRKQNDWKFG